MKKIFFAIVTVCLALTAVSCQRDLSTFTYDENPCVYFESPSASIEINADSQGKIQVPVYRVNAKGALDVPFTFTDKSKGMFTCAETSVRFEDGEDEATITVNYSDLSKFVLFEKYNFSLALQGNKFADVAVIDGGKPYVNVSIQKEVVKQDLGNVELESEYFGETLTPNIASAVEAPNHYYIENIYGAGYDLEFIIEDGEVTVFDGVPVDVYGAYGDVYIYVYDATYENGVLTIVAEFAVSAGSFGVCTEVITLPVN